MSKTKVKSLKDIKCFLLDMDGTIHLSGEAIDGAKESIDRMRKTAKVIFLTNNSSIGRADYVDKIRKMGIDACEDDIYTAGNATIDYLKANGLDKKVYLMGTAKLKAEFIRSGIELVEDNPNIVVIGFDTELTYEKLSKACTFIRNGVKFLATHPDLNCPTTDGYIPDVGSYLSLIKTSTGKDPFIICGKPYTPIGDGIASKTGVEPRLTAMVGDRLSTDIVFGNNNNYVTVLTLTGEATLDDLEKSGLKTDFIIDSIKNWDKY